MGWGWGAVKMLKTEATIIGKSHTEYISTRLFMHLMPWEVLHSPLLTVTSVYEFAEFEFHQARDTLRSERHTGFCHWHPANLYHVNDWSTDRWISLFRCLQGKGSMNNF